MLLRASVSHGKSSSSAAAKRRVTEATSITSHVLENVLDKSLLLSIINYNSLTVSDGDDDDGSTHYTGMCVALALLISQPWTAPNDVT